MERSCDQDMRNLTKWFTWLHLNFIIISVNHICPSLPVGHLGDPQCVCRCPHLPPGSTSVHCSQSLWKQCRWKLLLKPHLHCATCCHKNACDCNEWVHLPRLGLLMWHNKIECIRHLCKKTAVLRCHRCLKTLVLKKLTAFYIFQSVLFL